MADNRKLKSQSEEVAYLRMTEAARAAGVSKQSLQYYLMLGLLEPARRTDAGHQLFDAESVKRIRLIRQMNDSGYPLREIRDIFLQKHR